MKSIENVHSCQRDQSGDRWSSTNKMCNIPPLLWGGNCRFAIQMGAAKKGCMPCMFFQRAAAAWRSMYMEENIAESGVGTWRRWTLEKVWQQQKNQKFAVSLLILPTTSPRSVQRGGGGQLNKLRRMGILWTIAAIAIETRQLKTNRLVVILQKLWGFQRAETKTTGILSAYQWEAN